MLCEALQIRSSVRLNRVPQVYLNLPASLTPDCFDSLFVFVIAIDWFSHRDN